MESKKFALVVRSVALILSIIVCVGMGSVLSQTTGDLKVALVESAPTEVDPVVIAAETAYSEARAVQDPTAVDTGYAAPLGESQTVWASRDQSLVAITTAEVIAIGVAAFLIVFFVSKIIRQIIFSEQ